MQTPPTIHVALAGNDANDGLSPKTGIWLSQAPNPAFTIAGSMIALMAMELWNSDPVDCEIDRNRFNECVSLVEGATSPKTIRVHHNLFILEPGYSYAVEAGHHNLEIDHNVFRNGFYPISSFGHSIKNLRIHHNTTTPSGTGRPRETRRWSLIPNLNAPPMATACCASPPKARFGRQE